MSEWTKTGERIKAPDVETKTGVGQKSHSGTKSLLHPRTNNLQFLQRNLGNQAMQRLFESGTLQAKLQVSIPDDIYEQEADKVAHTVMRMPVLGVQRHLGLSINPQLANIENDTGQRLIQTETITTDLTIPIQRQITGNGEGQMRLTLGRQTHYGVIEKKRRTPMAIETGVQSADEILWTVKALFDKAEQMKVFLKDTFGKDRDLRVTSVVKEGEHTAYRKMDVVPAGNTAWEELAVAAAHAGFWVHAEGVRLEGKYWPLSPAATGAHLDLYLIKREFGDYPMPSTAGNHEEITIMTKNSFGQIPQDTTNLESKINSLKGRGQPLSESTRNFFEPRFGRDFSHIRVHTDSYADKSCHDLGARAFTYGPDIIFRHGEYNPTGVQGQQLLAHELVHTIQQATGVLSRIQKQPVPQASWEHDESLMGKGILFNTKEEANIRKSELEKDERWEEYTVETFVQNARTYFRVNVRGRRTMVNFLILLRKAEKAYPEWTKEQMLNSLRRLATYDTLGFQQMYGTTAASDIIAVPVSGFNREDVRNLRDMLRHEGGDEKETGIVKDFSGEYLAMGHVMTGISGGLHRNKKVDLAPSLLPFGEKMDNLYATTLSGDLGQSAVLVNENKQKGYVGKRTEATSAELVGDIDGIIIGEALAAAEFKKTWDEAKTLSDFIEIYYRSDFAKTRFRLASNWDEAYIIDQITRFAETYSYRNSYLAGAFSSVGTESEASYRAYKEWLSTK